MILGEALSASFYNCSSFINNIRRMKNSESLKKWKYCWILKFSNSWKGNKIENMVLPWQNQNNFFWKEQNPSEIIKTNPQTKHRYFVTWLWNSPVLTCTLAFTKIRVSAFTGWQRLMVLKGPWTSCTQNLECSEFYSNKMKSFSEKIQLALWTHCWIVFRKACWHPHKAEHVTTL